MEYCFTDGRVNIDGDKVSRGDKKKADYLLLFKNNIPLALVEAKGIGHSAMEGDQQVLEYADILDIPFAYTTNGIDLIEEDMILHKNNDISHFRNERKKIQVEKYIEQYFTKEMRDNYSRKQYSFYLGYLAHLLTDILWHEEIAAPCMLFHKEEVEADKQAFVWKMKADWYDLDFLYISKCPGFRAFQIYKDASGFQNTFMDIFAEDAFDNRREYIVGFYGEKRENLDREYPLLNEQRMERFVTEAAEELAERIKSYILEMENNVEMENSIEIERSSFEEHLNH